ncbi:6651_t:CDS:2 [Cetraspora pellucida]|uniref:6651_t:CDS:1 n=1 Tax=Cetraspora pellucida TaxID=1433469 RepID=A0A9N8ZE16_9GLOM|nr:6651_t:CDS:2 [Cetraspora pellucida]
MQTFSKYFKNLRINDYYYYPIAIAFKIVGQSQSVDETLKLEKINCFIDNSQMPSVNNLPNAKLITINDLTKKINKLVED